MSAKLTVLMLVILVFNIVFFMSMHNLDNAWNMRTVVELGIDVCDWNAIGTNCMDYHELYSFSVIALMFIFMWMSAVLIVVGISHESEAKHE